MTRVRHPKSFYEGLDAQGMKYCPRCKTAKDKSEFPKNKSDKKDGLNGKCKVCHAAEVRASYDPVQRQAYQLKRLYGLGWDKYANMYVSQGGRCEICGEEISLTATGQSKRGSAHVDHDHETGQIRGLLCNACNAGLGRFDDDLGIVRSAVEYLEKYKDQSG